MKIHRARAGAASAFGVASASGSGSANDALARRGGLVSATHCIATRLEKCSLVGCAGGRPTQPKAEPLCAAMPSRSITRSPAARNPRSAAVFPTPVRPPMTHTRGSGHFSTPGFSAAREPPAASSKRLEDVEAEDATEEDDDARVSDAGACHRVSTNRRNALYPPRTTRASSVPGGAACSRSHVNELDRMPPRQQWTYTTRGAWPRARAEARLGSASFASTRRTTSFTRRTSLGRTAFMPSTIATPLPCLANAVPTLARSSSVNSGMFSAPGTCPLANSPGDRTSTMSASAARSAAEHATEARTRSSTSARHSAPLEARSSFIPEANASMTSADNGADSSRSVAKRFAVDGPAIAPVDTAFFHDTES